MVTQVVPFPNDTKIPLVARCRKALKSVNPSVTPGFVSLEGYVAGRLVVEAPKRSENPVTRTGLLATIKKYRRLRPRWRDAEELDACFVVKDLNGQALIAAVSCLRTNGFQDAFLRDCHTRQCVGFTLNPIIGFGRDPSADDATTRKCNSVRTVFFNDS